MGSQTEWKNILKQRIDIADVVRRIPYADTTVSQAAMDQAVLFLDASKFRVQLMRRKKNLEAKLKALRSSVATSVRRQLANDGNARPTDKAVTERVDRNSDVQELEGKLADVEVMEEGAKLLLEACRMRGASFKAVTDMLGAEIYVQRKLDNQGTDLLNIRESMKEKLDMKYPGKKKKRAL